MNQMASMSQPHSMMQKENWSERWGSTSNPKLGRLKPKSSNAWLGSSRKSSSRFPRRPSSFNLFRAIRPWESLHSVPKGQVNAEGAAFRSGVLEREPAVVQLGDGTCNGKAQARPAYSIRAHARLVGAKESF